MAWANTSAAAASSSSRSRLAGPVVSNPSDHHAWPAARISVSSTSHPGSLPGPGRPDRACPWASRNRLIRQALAYRHPSGRVTTPAADRAAGKGPLAPGLDTPARASCRQRKGSGNRSLEPSAKPLTCGIVLRSDRRNRRANLVQAQPAEAKLFEFMPLSWEWSYGDSNPRPLACHQQATRLLVVYPGRSPS